jgi:Ca-activated chloride channel homolog
MTFKGTAILFSVIFATFSATTSLAQGVIVPIVCDMRPCRPRPIPQPLPNALPVKSIKIDTKINGQVASTHVEQIFRNDTQFTLEGTYFFPIPETASIVEFAIWENGKKLVGEVRSREEARRIYDEIVRRQKDPGLLEYAGKDLFQASIFPIPPNSDKILEITYSQILKADSGVVSYRYPLGTGHNLWQQRQEMRGSGTPKQKFGTISAKVEIVGNDALRNVYSPSHNIDIKQKNDRSASLSFETSENDNDFQLFYGWTNDDLGMSLLTYREPGKDGYFLLMVSPRDDMAERELVSKDIVFVLDTSGSMADAGKMDKARSALLFGVRTLRSGDRFNVINFAGDEHLMERGLVAADASGKKRAEDFINKLQPNGGTNINDSLLVSLRQFDRSERPKMLVFMTDGLPTVGETKIDRIAANVAKAKNVDVRIFPFGFGYDVNTALLDKLGTDNGGISDYVQPKEDLEVKVSSFFSRVSSPVLADLELDLGPVETEGVYPRKLGDLFKGMQAVIIGRYKNDNELRNLTVQLRGRTGKQVRTFTYSDLNFPERADENDFLPRLWASRRVGWLVEEIRNNGETKELRDEIVELGTRYGIVTPYTSYLATDGTFQAAARDARGLVNLAPTARAQMEEKSGAGAVQMSVQQNTMKLNKSLAVGDKDEAEQQVLVKNTMTNQFVGSKNFYRQASSWVDAEFKADAKLPESTIKFASDEYFALANREKGLARYLAIGDEVLIVWNNRVYRITK